MTVLTITYQGSADVHTATIDGTGSLIGVVGGGIGPVRALIGFASHRGAVDFRDSDQWVSARDMEELPGGMSLHLRGWYTVFLDADGIPVTFGLRIDRIEVSE